MLLSSFDEKPFFFQASIRRKKRSSAPLNAVSTDIKEETEDEIQDAILEEVNENHEVNQPEEKISSRRSSRSQSLNEESGGEERPRRHLNNNLMLDPSSSSRVVFPMEVKVCAIQRIRDGATKVQVARDLQCPVSTVSSWWHRRSSLIPEMASEDVKSDSASVSLNM